MSQQIKRIDVRNLKELKDNDKSLCLIDVREHHEWEEMHIPGAIHIPKDVITSEITKFAPHKNTPIYLHCRSGVRSLYAADCLLELGYEKVYSVDGGINDWAMNGYPISES